MEYEVCQKVRYDGYQLFSNDNNDWFRIGGAGNSTREREVCGDILEFEADARASFDGKLYDIVTNLNCNVNMSFWRFVCTGVTPLGEPYTHSYGTPEYNAGCSPMHV